MTAAFTDYPLPDDVVIKCGDADEQAAQQDLIREQQQILAYTPNPAHYDSVMKTLARSPK